MCAFYSFQWMAVGRSVSWKIICLALSVAISLSPSQQRLKLPIYKHKIAHRIYKHSRTLIFYAILRQMCGVFADLYIYILVYTHFVCVLLDSASVLAQNMLESVWRFGSVGHWKPFNSVHILVEQNIFLSEHNISFNYDRSLVARLLFFCFTHHEVFGSKFWREYVFRKIKMSVRVSWFVYWVDAVSRIHSCH